MTASYLVDTDWLASRLGADDVRIVDVRGHLQWERRHEDAPWRSAREDYDAAHIPGAVYLDFSSDLVDSADPVPLQAASTKRLAEVFGAAGIGDDHLVVAYDADRSVFATRLWWLFKLCGHDNVRVLDGGWPKWLSEDRPVTSSSSEHAPSRFTPRPAGRQRVELESLLESLQRPDVCVVDARAIQDFEGNPKWAERGGHIPGAVNLPASTLLRPDGTFKPVDQLHAAVCDVVPASGQVISYCGLGLSATAVAFVLDMLGYQDVQVYDGSWAEWGARADLPGAQAEHD